MVWHSMGIPTPISEDPTFIAAPTIHIGVTHQFLANVVKEIGGGYVTVVRIKEPNGSLEDTTDVCRESVVFFGLSADVDGWVKELCGSENDKTAVVFLDTYGDALVHDESTADTPPPTKLEDISETKGGYYWLTTQGGKDMVRAIAKVLSEIDPVHKVSYLDAAYATAYQLDDVYGSIKDKIYNLRTAPVIVWGQGWEDIIAEYEGKIVKTIPPPQNDQERELYIKEIAKDLMDNSRMIIVGDMSLPFDELKNLYRDGGRRIVLLDPWGDFSDIWPYKVFVQQNLLRITQAL